MIGTNFNEIEYLSANPDVAKAVAKGIFSSGREHYDLHGKSEGRSVLVDGTPIWFTHIPKCGGTTVTAAISATIPKFQVLPDQFMMQRRDGCEPSADAIALECREADFPIRLVHGHYHHSLHRLVPDAIRIVMLRDPVARSISNLHHLVRHQGVSASSIKATLAEGKLPFSDNLMTRFLAGSIDLSGNLHEQHDKMLHDPIESPDASLEMAVQALSGIEIVGILEQLESFKSDLAALGIEVGSIWKNRGGKSELQLSLEDHDAIRRNNQIDQSLYETAIEMSGCYPAPHPAALSCPTFVNDRTGPTA